MHFVCVLVAALIRPPAAGRDDIIHGVDDVFQMNHCLGDRIWLRMNHYPALGRTSSLTWASGSGFRIYASRTQLGA